MQHIQDASIRVESTDRYLAYALSVVTGRAIPDVRDGLKPVQRRILYAMFEDLKLLPDKGYRKSAAVVGAVLAKYHPHGDAACYEAMVRMAQEFSYRYPLVDGQGNFGSIDGDSAAAYRYTEAKLLPLALQVIGEINENTVDFRDNFDATSEEPTVFPARFPNVLVNGASGIAVGMATSIPPHNLKDTIKATLELLDDPDITDTKLARAIKGPDFPTGCAILNTKKEIDDLYKSGRGSVKMRATWKTENGERGKKLIIITSVPYAVNKSVLVEKIGSLIIDKKVPQLVDVRDESTDIVRVVLELASNAEAEIAMAYLFKHTPLETNFPVNLTILAPDSTGKLIPALMSLKNILGEFLRFREKTVVKRLEFEKGKLLERIHILEGLAIVFDALDRVIAIVRKSDGRADSIVQLTKAFKISEIQAGAIVDMRIYQLSRTNILAIKEELAAKQKRLDEIEKLLKSKINLQKVIREELEALSTEFGDKRRCEFDAEAAEVTFNAEDYVVHEDVYAVITKDGWVKRIRQTNEVSSTRVREGDSLLAALPVSTTDFVVFFTNFGAQYGMRVTEIPSSSGYGDPIQKHLKFRDGEKIINAFAVFTKESEQPKVQELFKSSQKILSLKDKDSVIILSKNGMGVGFTLDGLIQTRKAGRKVMNLKEGDEVVSVSLPTKEILLVTENTSSVIIETKEIPTRESAAVGVIAMSIREGDTLKFVCPIEKEKELTITFESGKEKTIPLKEVLHGRRALKGNKLGVTAEIQSLQVK